MPPHQSWQSRCCKPEQYDKHERHVSDAIAEAKAHPELKKEDIAAEYHIARSTLYDRISGKTKPRREAHTSQQRLRPEEEQKIADEAKRAEQAGMGLHHRDVRQIATDVLEERDPHPAPIGQHWVTHLVRRHEDIEMKVAHHQEQDRHRAQDRPSFQHYFEQLHKVVTRYKIVAEDIWNPDETGWEVGLPSRSREYIVSDSQRSRTSIADSSRSAWISLLDCISAVGQKLPACYLFKGQRHLLGGADMDADPNIAFIPTMKGRMDDAGALEWLKRHFDVHAPPSAPRRTRLLLLDSYGSHYTRQFLEECESRNIKVLSYPSHATQWLQPLDVAIFGQLKLEVNRQLEKFLRTHPRYTRPHLNDWIPMIEYTRQTAITPVLIKTAFNKAGIHPFNPHRVMTNPDIQWREEKPLHSYSTRSEGAANTPKTNLERLICQSEQKGEQVDKREVAIIQEAVGLQAENAILKARLEAYEKAPPVASRSQKSLGTGKYMTLRERKIARDAKIAEEKHKNVRKGTGRGRKRKACERDIIVADDSDVERQVAGLEAEDEEEEGVQQPPKRASRAT